MAQIINPIFGKISGKVGDFVFRNVNGKTFLCNRPKSRTSFTPDQVVRQNKFRINCKLSKYINAIDVYHNFWKKAAINKMSAFNAISKANYGTFCFNKDYDSPKLTPDSGKRDFSASGFHYHNGQIAIELKPDVISVIQDYKKDNCVFAAGVVCLSNPLSCDTEEYSFFNVKSDFEEVFENAESALFIELYESQRQLVELYESRMLYFGLVSMDKDGNIVNEESTYGEELTDY